MADFETNITTVLIYKLKGGKEVSINPGATGFFYKDGDDIYLVTNKHVAYEQDDDNNFTANQIADSFVCYFSNEIAAGITMNHPITLSADNMLQLGANPRVDILLVAMENDFLKNNAVIPVDKSFLRKGKVPSGTEIFTLGYTHGKLIPTLTDGESTDRCETDADGPFRMVGDIATFPGMSGSPVFDKTGAIFIGVHSGRHAHQKTMTSGAAVINDRGANIWFAELIAGILATAQ